MKKWKDNRGDRNRGGHGKAVKNKTRRWITILSGALILSCTELPVQAITTLTNDNHTDTVDYCMRAYDVTVGLKELQECDSREEMKQMILKAANPKLLYREDLVTEVEDENIAVDFHNFQPEANDDGYEMILTLPSLTEGEESRVTFRVYVTDDLPKTATIQFYGTDLPNMIFSLEEQAVLKWAEIPKPIKTGYTFVGWYLDEKLSRPFLLPDSPGYAVVTVTQDLNLYPAWEKDKETSVKGEQANGKPAERMEDLSEEISDEQENHIEKEETPAGQEKHTEKSEASDIAEKHVGKSKAMEAAKTGNHMKTEKQKDSNAHTEAETVAAVGLAVIDTGLIASALADLKILMWYARKKKNRRKES